MKSKISLMNAEYILVRGRLKTHNEQPAGAELEVDDKINKPDDDMWDLLTLNFERLASKVDDMQESGVTTPQSAGSPPGPLERILAGDFDSPITSLPDVSAAAPGSGARRTPTQTV